MRDKSTLTLPVHPNICASEYEARITVVVGCGTGACSSTGSEAREEVESRIYMYGRTEAERPGEL